MNNRLAQNLPFIIILAILLIAMTGGRIIPFFILAGLAVWGYRKLSEAQMDRIFKNFNIKDLFTQNSFEAGSSKNMSQTIDMDKLKQGKHLKKLIATVVVVILLAWLFAASIVIVEAGETGVYSLFGRVKDKEMQSGFHLVIPLARVTKMSIRTNDYTMSSTEGEGEKRGPDAITALSKEGLDISLDITILYHLQEDRASDVYEDVGLNYEEKIIRPAIRSTIRKIIAQYEAKVIYSDKRKEASDRIMEELKEKLEPRGVVMEETLLRNVKLPPKLANSIEEKLQAEQEAKKMDFVLQKEEKEKQRKIIEAEGQKGSQRIINESLTPNYLQYLYIKNLENREGTIYVPTNPDNGMPMFKNIGG